MGGSTVVLVESALQDLMWHFTRVRCPPTIIQHTRQRLQRLMSDVSLSEAVKATEAQETATDFCGGLVLDMLDDILYTKIPFVEVDHVQKELERVSFANEVLKLRIEEKDELDHLRQLALSRKDDALIYTVHKYFEEVFILRKERAKLTSLLRESQRKVKKLELWNNNNNNNNYNNNSNLNASSSSFAAGSQNTTARQSPVDSHLGYHQHQHHQLSARNSLAGGTFAAMLNLDPQNQQNQIHQVAPPPPPPRIAAHYNLQNQQFTMNAAYADSIAAIIGGSNINCITDHDQSPHQNQQLQRTLSTVTFVNTNETDVPVSHHSHAPATSKSKVDTTTMAVFCYDELAARMMLSDPDLATLKLHNLKLVRELEEHRAKFQNQKRDMILKYETKIRQLEAKLSYLLEGEDGAESRDRSKNARIHVRQLRPLKAALRSVAEGFETAKYAIRVAMSDFGETFIVAKHAIDESMQQVLVNEEICANHVNYATEYMNALCESVGKAGGDDDDDDDDDREDKSDKKSSDPHDGSEKKNNKENKKGENKNQIEDKNVNEQQQQQAEDQHFKQGDPINTARQLYEACLEIGPFDDHVTAKSKRYFRQHDVSAFIRSSVSSVTQNVEQFSELVRRLKLLSKYASRERSQITMYEMSKYHDEILQKKRREKREKRQKAQGLQKQLQLRQGEGQRGNDDDDDDDGNNNDEDADGDTEANPTLIALSAAARVAGNRKYYLRLFQISLSNPDEADHQYYGLDQRMTTEPEEGHDNADDAENEGEDSEKTQPVLSEFVNSFSQGPYRESVRERIKLRFKRIAARCVRNRMLQNYESFRSESIDGENEEHDEDQDEDDDIDVDGTFESECEDEKRKASLSCSSSKKNKHDSKGPFESHGSFEQWKKRLQRHSRFEDEQFSRKIATLRERTKRIVAQCISRLPSSLLVKIIMDRNFKPTKYEHFTDGQEVVAGAWFSPFTDFDFSHTPEHGEDWGGGTSSNNSDREGSSGGGKSRKRSSPSSPTSATGAAAAAALTPALYRHLRVTCPECGKRFLAALPTNFSRSGHFFSRLRRDSDLSKYPLHHRQQLRLNYNNDIPNRRHAASTAGRSEGDKNNDYCNDENDDASSSLSGTRRPQSSASTNVGGRHFGFSDDGSEAHEGNEVGSDDEDKKKSLSSSSAPGNNNINSTTSVKKVLRFSSHIHEVLPESMIPVAAAASRQGFFAAPPPSHFVTKMASGQSTGGRRSSTSSLQSGSLSGGDGVEADVNSMAGAAVGEDHLQLPSFLSGSSLFTLHNSTAGQTTGDPFLDSILYSPAPKSILRQVSNNNNNNNNNRINDSSVISADGDEKNIHQSGSHMSANRNNNNINNRNDNDRPDVENNKISSQIMNVGGKSSSTLSAENLPLDDGDEARLMLVTKLRTKFGTDIDSILANPRPYVIPSAAIGNIPSKVVEQSIELSTRGAAKQFVRQKHREQILLAQMLAMQQYLRQVKERDREILAEQQRHTSMYRQRDDDDNEQQKQFQQQQKQKVGAGSTPSATIGVVSASGSAPGATVPFSPPPKRPNSSTSSSHYSVNNQNHVPTTLESLSNLGINVIDPKVKKS